MKIKDFVLDRPVEEIKIFYTSEDRTTYSTVWSHKDFSDVPDLDRDIVRYKYVTNPETLKQVLELMVL